MRSFGATCRVRLLCTFIVLALCLDVAYTQQIEFEAQGGTLWANGTPFVIKGVTWEGFEGDWFVADGLWAAKVDDIINKIVQNGFNTVRFTIAMEIVLTPRTPYIDAINVGLNPEFASAQRPTAFSVLQAIINKLATLNVLVVISASSHSGLLPGHDELWYSEDYDMPTVFQFWETLSIQLCTSWNVIGVDLWDRPYGVARWGNFSTSPETDWAKGSASLGNFVNDKCSRWLLFVQGVSQNNVGEKWFWGSDLRGARSTPVALSAPAMNRLVYSVPVWPPSYNGPSLFDGNMTYFSDPAFPNNMPAIWDYQFGWIPAETGVPLVLSNWGANIGSQADRAWFDTLVTYLLEKNIGIGFTRLNPDEPVKGIILPDWVTVDNYKISAMNQFHTDSVLAFVSAGYPTTRRLRFQMIFDADSVDPFYVYSPGTVSLKGNALASRLAQTVQKASSTIHLESIRPYDYLCGLRMDFVPDSPTDGTLVDIVNTLRSATLQRLTDATGGIVRQLIPPSNSSYFPSYTPTPFFTPSATFRASPTFFRAPATATPTDLPTATALPVIMTQVCAASLNSNLPIVAGAGGGIGGVLLVGVAWLIYSRVKKSKKNEKKQMDTRQDAPAYPGYTQEMFMSNDGQMLTEDEYAKYASMMGLDPNTAGYPQDADGLYQSNSPSRASLHNSPSPYLAPSRAGSVHEHGEAMGGYPVDNQSMYSPSPAQSVLSPYAAAAHPASPAMTVASNWEGQSYPLPHPHSQPHSPYPASPMNQAVWQQQLQQQQQQPQEYISHSPRNY